MQDAKGPLAPGPLAPGPLAGLRVIELAGIGPGPMCAMLLADLGASVLRIDRIEPSGLGVPRPPRFDVVLRNRRSIALDLKRPEATRLVLDLVERADALIEGFRPGTAERLGLGPGECLGRNPALVYGRMTGWGQDGPLAHAAGHDINYIALAGALGAIGRPGQPPTPPLNLLGDYGGGSLYLALGLLAALLEARGSGRGQVVDAAIVDGTASLLTMLCGLHAAGLHSGERGTNMLDGGAWYYDAYECADGRWVSIGCIEDKFRRVLLERVGIDPAELPDPADPGHDAAVRQRLAGRLRERSRDEWCALLEGSDACFAPVLSLAEAPRHPHLAARRTFVEVDGVVQPAPAPRFSRTPPADPVPHRRAEGEEAEAALAGWLDAARLAQARADGLLAARPGSRPADGGAGR